MLPAVAVGPYKPFLLYSILHREAPTALSVNVPGQVPFGNWSFSPHVGRLIQQAKAKFFG
jgi:hypothetical protein